MPPLTGAIFLSWCHRDAKLKEDLLQRLHPNLTILAGVRLRWWEDSHLLRRRGPGRGHPRAAGLLWLRRAPSQPRLLRKRVHHHARAATIHRTRPAPRCLPVLLKPLPLDHSRNLRGIEQKIIFRYRDRAYSQLQSAGRDAFASELATQIRRRVIADGARTP